MANLAQLVNVLQAVILTDKEKMILTPTYHVLRMFNVHQDAELLPFELETEDYVYKGDTIPAVSGSASKDSEGTVHISLCNLNPNKIFPFVVSCGELHRETLQARFLQLLR